MQRVDKTQSRIACITNLLPCWQFTYLMSVPDKTKVDLDLPEKPDVDEVGEERHYKLVLVLTGCVVKVEVEDSGNISSGLLQMFDVLEKEICEETAVLSNVVPVPIERYMIVASRLQTSQMRLCEVLACNAITR
jgi:hypothetical protein